MLKHLIILITTVLLSNLLVSQSITWTKFENLNDSLKNNPKKVIIKIETDWCGYCKLMDANIYKHKKIKKKLSNDYYFVKLNAESKQPIIFRNRQFNPNKKPRGKHELAVNLNGLNNTMSYPTTVVLTENLVVEKRLNGYLKRNHFLLWLTDSNQ